ncbi:MAG TPA: metalloregulator ArsR/SmtB family transcription factor [Sandaracinaceae bacterium LLY-WYZ-13_1]|nr:metalloregulator ArsR/SmtB family transcription factor [Sandaracinaceae bacterium LLY-WYZ-13_1]
MNVTTLADSSAWLTLFADPTRVRLLSLLGREELSVAELTRVTGLGQSRVSTHLGKLRDASLLSVRKQGASTYYRASAALPEAARRLWATVTEQLDDAVLTADRERCEALVEARERAWPDAVAGQMERHYSPGRTWEATARGFLGLIDLGDVLDAGSGDGTLAALIAPRARSVTCLDRSETVLDAARRRLRDRTNVSFARGDLRELPFEAARFDRVMLFNVLTYVPDAARALAEAARVLRPGGHLAIVTLRAHDRPDVTEAYGHLVPGYEVAELRGLLEGTSLAVDHCAVTSRERRKPYFEVITAFARKEPDA